MSTLAITPSMPVPQQTQTFNEVKYAAKHAELLRTPKGSARYAALEEELYEMVTAGF